MIAVFKKENGGDADIAFYIKADSPIEAILVSGMFAGMEIHHFSDHCQVIDGVDTYILLRT